MVRFVETGDPRWAEENIASALGTFSADAAWVFNPDLSLVHVSSQEPGPSAGESPVNRDVLRRVFAEKHFVHFFLSAGDGLLEVRGATIHPTADAERLTPLRGYFLVGRRWDEEHLAEIESATGGSATLLAPDVRTSTLEPGPEALDAVVCQHDLPSWDGNTLATLQVRIPHSAVPVFATAVNSVLRLGSGLALATLVVLAWLLVVWIARPLWRTALQAPTLTMACQAGGTSASRSPMPAWGWTRTQRRGCSIRSSAPSSPVVGSDYQWP